MEQIAGYARRNGISKIVIGRTVQKPHLFYVKPTLIDRLIKRLPNMDIYVIPDSNAGPQSRKREFLEIFRVKSKSDFLKTAVILGAATLLSALLYRLRAGEINVVMVYIMGVVWVAYATGGLSLIHILLVGALSFFPALSLGPVAEYFEMIA